MRSKKTAGMRPLHSFMAFVLWASIPCMVNCRADASQQERITLLMTQPKTSELKNIVSLKEQGMLHVPGLRLVGLIHQDEWKNYKSARKYLRKQKPGWIELKKISCKLDQDAIYRDNHCSSVYRQLFEGSTGILFTGGPDIPPEFYGRKTLLTTSLKNLPRHVFEISFLFHLLGSRRNPKQKPLLSTRPNYAIIGICMGMQSINVASGGTLIQDIPSEVYKIRNHEDGIRLPPEKVHRSHLAALYPSPDIGRISIHSIRLIGKSTIRSLLLPQGKTIKVASLHHQAIEKLGKHLEIFATSLDGKIVEGLRHKNFPGVIGVQFHPEKQQLWNSNLTVRKSKQASMPKNYLSHWYTNDKQAQDFHQAFWRLVGELIVKSSKKHPEQPHQLSQTCLGKTDECDSASP